MCPLGDDWHDTFVATGYPCCLRCREHHRHPETCPGITPDGEPADYPDDYWDPEPEPTADTPLVLADVASPPSTTPDPRD